MKYSDGSEHIVVVGGEDVNKGLYSMTEIFDLQTQTWSIGDKLQLFHSKTVSSLLVGKKMDKSFFNTLYYFDPELKKWEQRKETMKERRSAFASFLVSKNYCP